MSPGEAVKLVLAADSRVTDRVAQRIFPVRIPEGVVTWPVVVYTVISQVPQDTFESDGGVFTESRVQIDCYARQYLDSDLLAEAVEDVLLELDSQAMRVLKLDRRDLFESEALLHRASLDFSVWRTR